MSKVTAPSGAKFSSYERFVVAILALLQFSIVLDFMVLSPLGAVLMPTLQITTSQFGLVVSGYAFSASLSGLLAAGFADRFDRKRLLLFFYTGFIVGTLLCGLATTYEWLLVARIVTGLFGGVIGSITMAITTDLFPINMRGRVMGIVQTAFAASQVLGIPVSLYLSARFSWQAPFFLIVGVSVMVWAVIAWRMQPIDRHIALQAPGNPFLHLLATLRVPRYLVAFATTALLTTGGFMLMPFSSAFSVNNLGIALDELPMVYMVTGIVAMISGPLVGRLTDAVGKLQTFAIGSLITIVFVTIYTNLGRTPLPWVMAINASLFIGITARIIASQALISIVPKMSQRGAFMAVSSSIQQVSGGLASVIAGQIVVAGADGTLSRFDTLGLLVSLATIASVALMYQINQLIQRDTPASQPGPQALAEAGAGHH